MNEVAEQEGQKGNLSKVEIEQSSGACTPSGILAASRRIISLENKLSRLLEATKRMDAALNAMIIWIEGEPHYRTHGDIPQQMPITIARTAKKARVLLEESSK